MSYKHLSMPYMTSHKLQLQQYTWYDMGKTKEMNSNTVYHFLFTLKS